MYQVVSVCIGVPSAFSSVHHVAMASFVELWRKIAADEAKFRRKTGTCESSPEGGSTKLYESWEKNMYN